MELDLRQATFATDQVEITANAVLGDIKIIVDAHTRVVIAGTAILGDFGPGRDRIEPELTDQSPTVRIDGVALLADVKVIRRAAPGSDADRRRFLPRK